MSSGKVHARDSLAIAFAGAVPVTLMDWRAGLGWLAGGVVSVAIGPDLDVDGLTASEYKIIKRTLGFGFLFVWFWFYYARLFRHRGSSHWPVVGTLVRIGYAFALSTLLYGFGVVVGRWNWPTVQVSTGWTVALVGAVLALVVCDVAHWVRDNWQG